MRLVLVALVVALAMAALAQHTTCVLGPLDSALYVSTAAANEALSTCSQFAELACCTEAYDAQVAAGTARLSQLFLGSLRADSVQDACLSAVQTLACLACDPSQSLWSSLLVRNTSTSVLSLRLCSALCDNLYANCGEAVLSASGESVFQTYPSAAAMCYRHLKQPDLNPVPAPTGDCYGAGVRFCEVEDYHWFYTACDPTTATRSLAFFLPPNVSCVGGTVPDPVGGLPCDIACAEGSFLPPGDTVCRNCSAGSSSLGGGIANADWSVWPSNMDFFVTCGNATGRWPCDWGWTLEGAYVRSADSLADLQSAYLALPIRLESDGFVMFEARVSAEQNFDGLVFTVDRTQLLGTTNRPLSNTNGWQTFQFPLRSGWHYMEWAFVKDRSVSMGDDAAFIRFVEISGTELAVSSCTPCAPGHYSGDAATHCTECAPGTYAAGTGNAYCFPCADGYYSLDGAAACTIRPPCTIANYAAVNSSCSDGVNHVVYTLLQGAICAPSNPNSWQPPTSAPSRPCGPCPLGTFRAAGSSVCQNCAPGFYTPAATPSTCVACAARKFADSAMVWPRYQWDSWRFGMTTGCLGNECNSNGWRLRGDYIDSGYGHGFHGITVWMDIPFTLTSTQDVRLEFEWALQNTTSFLNSYMQIVIDPPTNFFVANVYASSLRSTRAVVLASRVPAGAHVMRVSYQMISTDQNRATHAEIYSMRLHGPAEGSGIGCLDCAPGSVAPVGSASCTVCTPGQFVLNNTCAQCPANTFSSAPGATACSQCGPNVYTPPGSAECVQTCVFNAGPAETYDLNGLSTWNGDDMYGPVRDRAGHTYYLNPCSLAHANHTCFAPDGSAIPAFVCQTTVQGLGEDLGHVLGYLPLNQSRLNHSVVTAALAAGARSGFIAVYTGGSLCPRISNYRRTNITFVCNPRAGAGMPVGLVPVEGPTCAYNFVWESLWACSRCLESDYVEIASDCDASGSQSVFYAWRENPPRCHGGVALPAATSRACIASETVCGAGAFVTATEQCVNATPGYFTTGGKHVYAVFERDTATVPEPFTTTCGHAPDAPAAATCSGWSTRDTYLRSGSGAGSWTTLSLTVSLVRAGSLSFRYRLSGALDQPLRFQLDALAPVDLLGAHSQDLDAGSSGPNAPFAYEPYAVALGTGPHLLSWTVPNAALVTATLGDIVIDGVAWSAQGETPCPAGYVAPGAGASACAQCPPNTASNAERTECVPCPAGWVSGAGASQCQQLLAPCTADDYVAQPATRCDPTSREQTLSYTLLPTARCIDSAGAAPAPVTVACEPCAPGYVASSSSNDDDDDDASSTCVACAAPLYFDLVSRSCLTRAAGFRSTAALYAPAVAYDWPAGWTRGCGGEACNVSAATPLNVSALGADMYGWKMRGARFGLLRIADGGLADVYFGTSANVAAPGGAVSFGYSGMLSFFVNGVRVPLAQSPVTVPLPAGVSHLIWSYHYDSDSSTSLKKRALAALATVDSVVVTNVVGAPSVGAIACPPGTSASDFACTPCPAGTFSDAANIECTPCPAGTVATGNGTAACVACAPGTAPSADHTVCASSCVFQSGADTFNVSHLGLAPLSLQLGDGRALQLSLCSPMLSCGSESFNKFACTVDTTLGIKTVATSLAVALPVSINVSSLPLTFTYTGAADALCPNGRTTVVRFECASATLVDEMLSEECLIVIDISSVEACRVCTAVDYQPSQSYQGCAETTAKSGYQYYELVAGDLCNGPAMYLNSTLVPCPVPWTPWKPKDEPMSPSEVLGIVLLILVAIAIVALVGFVLNGCIVKHRKLARNYAILSTPE